MSEAEFGYITPENLTLFTDLYELTMLQGYHLTGHMPRATFDLFFRSLPPNRGYAIAAGLEQAIHYLESVTFSPRAIDYLAEEGFDDDFLDVLADFSFSGDVRALPEGTPAFPDEPLMTVTAPIVEAQLFETMLINQVGFGTLIATKAARMRDQVDRHGDDQALVDFGSRRAHGTDAGMKAARAAVVGGFTGTSNVAAGETFDIPVFGTMAHSWIQSFPTERAAFEAFVDVYGEDSILLVDTYDTIEGTKLAMDVAREKGVDIAGVRLDSGDLTGLSKAVDPIVGDAGVFISSGVDEYLIRDFLGAGGVSTGFGPGTSLVTSADAPKLETIYKLVAVEEDGALRPSMKLSSGKVTHPGPKGVRRVEENGRYVRDVVATADEATAGTEQLVSVFEGGRRVYDLPDLESIRERAGRERRKLPEPVRALEDPATYPVEVSDGLAALTDRLRAELEASA